MPVPPLNYVKLYTDENIKAGRAPRWTFSEIITIVLTYFLIQAPASYCGHLQHVRCHNQQ